MIELQYEMTYTNALTLLDLKYDKEKNAGSSK